MSNFSEIMQQAVRLRQATDSTLRSKFDSYPIYIQGTLYSGESDIVKQARNMSTTTSDAVVGFEKRLEIANTLKSEGNRLLADGEALLASQKYEAALAVFVCLVNIREDWKKRGIKDEDISLDVYRARNEAESERLKVFKVACYLNIALSYAKQCKHDIAVVACGSALEVDCNCVKALFRRAQYISSPASAGATEQNMAIRDLEEASSLAPTNREVRSLLLKLKQTRHNQSIADKRTFRGLFERGSIIGKENTKTSGGKDRQQHTDRKSWLEYRKEVEWNVSRLEAEAREAQSLLPFQDQPEKVEIIRENYSQLQSWLNSADAEIEKRQQERIQRIDWRNPTPEAVEEAKSKGIDLTDTEVIDMLEEYEEEARIGGKQLGRQNQVQHLNGEDEGGDSCNDLEGLLKKVRQARRSELISVCKYFNVAEERKGLWTELSLTELRERVVVAVRKSVAIDDNTTRSSFLVGCYSRYLFTFAIVLIFIAWRIHVLGILDTMKYF